MSAVERVKTLCKEKNIPLYRLEKDLGFANAYISQLRMGTIPYDRAVLIADYLGVAVDYILTGQQPEQTSDSGKKYYFSDETAQAAQHIYENKDLRLLFDAARDAEPADLKVVHDMLLALKRKEKGDDNK